MPLNLTRSLLVVLIPGGIALFPWVIWLIGSDGRIAKFYGDYPQLSWGVLFAAVVVVGSLFEGFSSYLEDRWDRQREKEWDVSKNWYDYLGRVCPSQPVGHSYLARLATTMYFELAMMWAAFFFVMGLVPILDLWRASDVPLDRVYVLAGFVGGTATAFFRKAAHDSHLALCRTRKEINRRLNYLDAKQERRRFGPGIGHPPNSHSH